VITANPMIVLPKKSCSFTAPKPSPIALKALIHGIFNLSSTPSPSPSKFLPTVIGQSSELRMRRHILFNPAVGYRETHNAGEQRGYRHDRVVLIC
jgi:hypothetical protein